MRQKNYLVPLTYSNANCVNKMEPASVQTSICFDNLWEWSDVESDHSEESVDCYIACRTCRPEEYPSFKEFTNVELQVKIYLLGRLERVTRKFYEYVFTILTKY